MEKEAEEKTKVSIKNLENSIEKFSNKWLEGKGKIYDLNSIIRRTTEMEQKITKTEIEYEVKLDKVKREIEYLSNKKDDDHQLKNSDIRKKIKNMEANIDKLETER